MLKLIIMSTGDVTLRLVKQITNNPDICLLGVIQDESVDLEYKKEFAANLKKINVDILDNTEAVIKKADMVFCVEYRKIIKNFVSNVIYINCHAGILPKWRGFGANGWAIINNAKKIGYTYHEMTKDFDGGDIYYVGVIPILQNQTYSDVHDKMINGIIENTGIVLQKIYNGTLKPVPNTGKHVYCHRFNRDLGNVTGFNMSSKRLYNLYRAMAKPLGTGLYFYYRDKRYDISKVELGSEYDVDDYMGIVGKIVYINNESIWVKTQDNVIVLYLSEQEKINDFFIGNKIE